MEDMVGVMRTREEQLFMSIISEFVKSAEGAWEIAVPYNSLGCDGL